jgi:hypothetical protein
MHALFKIPFDFELAKKSVNSKYFLTTVLANYKLAELINGVPTIESSKKIYLFQCLHRPGPATMAPYHRQVYKYCTTSIVKTYTVLYICVNHSLASVFRHPSSQSGTGAFRYRTCSAIVVLSIQVPEWLDIRQSSIPVAHSGCSLAQRAQLSSAGWSLTR